MSIVESTNSTSNASLVNNFVEKNRQIREPVLASEPDSVTISGKQPGQDTSENRGLVAKLLIAAGVIGATAVAIIKRKALGEMLGFIKKEAPTVADNAAGQAAKDTVRQLETKATELGFKSLDDLLRKFEFKNTDELIEYVKMRKQDKTLIAKGIERQKAQLEEYNKTLTETGRPQGLKPPDFTDSNYIESFKSTINNLIAAAKSAGSDKTSFSQLGGGNSDGSYSFARQLALEMGYKVGELRNVKVGSAFDIYHNIQIKNQAQILDTLEGILPI